MISTLIQPTNIDECSESISSCSQLCSNTTGSYSCLCHIGYQLDNDNHTCLGRVINALIMIDIPYNGSDINECQVKMKDVNKSVLIPMEVSNVPVILDLLVTYSVQVKIT